MKLHRVLCGLFTITIVFSCLITENSAQQQEQEQQRRCFNQLRFCLNYLNNSSSQPSDNCCQPLDYVIRSVPECMCTLLSSVGGDLAQRLGINISRAQTLPSRCGHIVNPLGCITGDHCARASVYLFFIIYLSYNIW